MLQVFRAAIVKLSVVFVYVSLSCHFENFGSETPCLLLIRWKQDLRMTVIGEFHWGVTLENWSLGHFAHLQTAQAFKDTCFTGLWNVISLLFEFGMHWIKSVRQNQMWQLLTFNRVCSSAKNLTGKLWYMFFLLFNFEIQLSVEN